MTNRLNRIVDITCRGGFMPDGSGLAQYDNIVGHTNVMCGLLV